MDSLDVSTIGTAIATAFVTGDSSEIYKEIESRLTKPSERLIFSVFYGIFKSRIDSWLQMAEKKIGA